MSFTLGIGVTGATELADQLDAVAGRLEDIGPLLEAIHQSFLTAERARFDAEGPGWAALAASTLAEKGRKGYPSDILVAAGQLRDSLTDDDASGSIWEPSVYGAVMGTDYRSPSQTGEWADVALGVFHQEGTTRMPARPIIDLSDEQITAWPVMVADWIFGEDVSVNP